jgi:LuxR family maltose regulon positive regulatory protein
MRHEDVLVTKLVPPRPQRRVLPGPALAARLGEALDYRLTLLHAGTGYGKTTALAALDGREAALFWYSVGEADADPYRQQLIPAEVAAQRLDGAADGAGAADQADGPVWEERIDREPRIEDRG